MTASLHSALQDLNLHHAWIMYPGKEKYKIDERVTVLPLASIVDNASF